MSHLGITIFLILVLLIHRKGSNEVFVYSESKLIVL